MFFESHSRGKDYVSQVRKRLEKEVIMSIQIRTMLENDHDNKDMIRLSRRRKIFTLHFERAFYCLFKKPIQVQVVIKIFPTSTIVLYIEYTYMYMESLLK